MSWTAALGALRVLLVGGKSAYTVKSYHDKVKKLGGGKPEKLGEKDVAACTNGEMEKIVKAAKKVLADALALEKKSYAEPPTNTKALWKKMSDAYNKKGPDSKEYAAAKKTYLAELRYLDKELDKQIKEISTAKPVLETNLTSTKAFTKYAKTLEDYFLTCAKVPSLGGWQAAFFALSRDCATYRGVTQSIEGSFTRSIAACKTNLATAQDTKKINLEWITFVEGPPPRDAAHIKKNTTATRPKK